MATHAIKQVDSEAPEVVGAVLAIPVAEIEPGKRLRPVDPVHAQALAHLMYISGQDLPVEVCRLPGRSGWTLVTGAHRLAAARINNWDTIKAIAVSADALERRRKEVSENLFHSGLKPLDRAAFVAELFEIERARAGIAKDAKPQEIAASARWSKALKAEADDASANIARAYGMAEDVAAAVHLSRRSIYLDLALHRGLPAHLADRLRSHPIAANAAQLRALAKLSPDDQGAAADLILGGQSRNVSGAVAVLRQKPAPSPQAKAWSAFFGGWSRMSAAQRSQALAELAERGLPKGVRIDFGDAS